MAGHHKAAKVQPQPARSNRQALGIEADLAGVNADAARAGPPLLKVIVAPPVVDHFQLFVF